MNKCSECGKEPLAKNELGICKKLLSKGSKKVFCIDCLAEYLGVEVEDILDKIEEFKDEGCDLFE